MKTDTKTGRRVKRHFLNCSGRKLLEGVKHRGNRCRARAGGRGAGRLGGNGAVEEVVWSLERSKRNKARRVAITRTQEAAVRNEREPGDHVRHLGDENNPAAWRPKNRLLVLVLMIKKSCRCVRGRATLKTHNTSTKQQKRPQQKSNSCQGVQGDFSYIFHGSQQVNAVHPPVNKSIVTVKHTHVQTQPFNLHRFAFSDFKLEPWNKKMTSKYEII